MSDGISGFIAELPRKKQRGSLPRCLAMTSGDDIDVARTITALVSHHASIVPGKHGWAPRGFEETREHQLHSSPLLPVSVRTELADWWFAVKSARANSPNWDLIAQCTIGGKEGLILVEAKAHDAELKAAGKALTSKSNMQNHKRIRSAIEEARVALEGLRPGWSISIDTHYQLANRFAWSWALASRGIPVVLLYLGFTNAKEMTSEGEPIRDDAHWAQILDDYGRGVVPSDIWINPLVIGDTPLIALRRTLPIDLPGGNPA